MFINFCIDIYIYSIFHMMDLKDVINLFDLFVGNNNMIICIYCVYFLYIYLYIYTHMSCLVSSMINLNDDHNERIRIIIPCI